MPEILKDHLPVSNIFAIPALSIISKKVPKGVNVSDIFLV